jgi:hypothetical protein
VSVRPSGVPSAAELLQRLLVLQEQTNAILERQLVPLQEEANALRRANYDLTQRLLATAGGGAAEPQVVAVVDLTPDGISSVSQATGDDFGETSLVSFPVYIPAGQEFVLLITPPAGRSVQIKGGLKAESDTYLALVEVADLRINGQEMLQPGLVYLINSPKEFNSAVNLIVGQLGIYALFVNASAYDVTLYVSAESLHLTDDYVNHDMLPALQRAGRATKALATVIGG